VDRERQLHDAAVLSVGTLRRGAERDEGEARQHHDQDRREAERQGPRTAGSTGRGERPVDERRQHGERREQERDRIAVEDAGGGGHERA